MTHPWLNVLWIVRLITGILEFRSRVYDRLYIPCFALAHPRPTFESLSHQNKPSPDLPIPKLPWLKHYDLE